MQTQQRAQKPSREMSGGHRRTRGLRCGQAQHVAQKRPFREHLWPPSRRFPSLWAPASIKQREIHQFRHKTTRQRVSRHLISAACAYGRWRIRACWTHRDLNRHGLHSHVRAPIGKHSAQLLHHVGESLDAAVPSSVDTMSARVICQGLYASRLSVERPLRVERPLSEHLLASDLSMTGAGALTTTVSACRADDDPPPPSPRDQPPLPPAPTLGPRPPDLAPAPAPPSREPRPPPVLP